MTSANVTIGVRKINEFSSILDIQGEINSYAENALMDAYTKSLGNQTRSILLNFEGLKYMNSSGIGLLVTLLIRVQRQKQRLLAYGLGEHYKQIFELTRLNEAISIFNNENEAISAANSN